MQPFRYLLFFAVLKLCMEYTGFEPVASTMRMLRAPNCANTPDDNGNNGARTHDLPLVRRALSQLSYVSTSVVYYITHWHRCIDLIFPFSVFPHYCHRLHMLGAVPFLNYSFRIMNESISLIRIIKIISFFVISNKEHAMFVRYPCKYFPCVHESPLWSDNWLPHIDTRPAHNRHSTVNILVNQLRKRGSRLIHNFIHWHALSARLF